LVNRRVTRAVLLPLVATLVVLALSGCGEYPRHTKVTSNGAISTFSSSTYQFDISYPTETFWTEAGEDPTEVPPDLTWSCVTAPAATWCRPGWSLARRQVTSPGRVSAKSPPTTKSTEASGCAVCDRKVNRPLRRTVKTSGTARLAALSTSLAVSAVATPITTATTSGYECSMCRPIESEPSDDVLAS
jgi:hypothetical protein